MENPSKFVASNVTVYVRKAILIGLAFFGANLSFNFDKSQQGFSFGMTQQAQARGFVAARGVGIVDRGVARRTARRVSRRWAVGSRLFSLPGDCYWGGENWYCEEDGVSFQQINENNTVVYICL